MSYEVLLLMNRMKAEQEKRERTAWIKKGNDLSSVDSAGVEKLIVSDPFPVPDLNELPNLRELSVSTMLDVDQVSSMKLRGLTSVSINVKPFSGSLKVCGDRLKSLRIFVGEVDDRLPLIDSTDHGSIDLSEASALVEISLHHVSSYKICLPYVSGLKGIRIVNSNDIDMNPVMNNTHIIHLTLLNCEIKKTSFLEQFYDLEELDLSYNRIEEAPELFRMSALKSLCIRKNPLLDPERYRLPQLEKVIITEKDYRINSFAGMIKCVPYNAYSSIKRVKDPKKTSPFIRNHYNDSTDEEIFTDFLVMGIASFANSYENPSWEREIPLTRQETDGVILKLYPYLSDRIRAFREKRIK